MTNFIAKMTAKSCLRSNMQWHSHYIKNKCHQKYHSRGKFRTFITKFMKWSIFALLHIHVYTCSIKFSIVFSHIQFSSATLPNTSPKIRLRSSLLQFNKLLIANSKEKQKYAACFKFQ